MRSDLRQLILIALGSAALLLYLVSLIAPKVRSGWHRRLDAPADSSLTLLAERRFVLKWFEKAGEPSTMRLLLVALPITVLGLIGLLFSLSAEMDEAGQAIDREILRYGRGFANDSEVDSLADSAIGLVIFSPFLLITWTFVNAWAYEGVRTSYAWAVRAGHRWRFVAGILLTLFIMCCPGLAALVLLKFEVNDWLVGVLLAVSPVWLLAAAYDGAGRCGACALAMVPAGLTAPILAVVVGVLITAIRDVRHGLPTLAGLLPSGRMLRLIAGHVALLTGLAAFSALPAEAWLLVAAGAILESLALPGLVRAAAGPARAARWSEWLAARHARASIALRRSFDMMASWIGFVLCVSALVLMLLWVARHASDPMPLFPAPSLATGLLHLVWTPVLALWLAAATIHVLLLAAEATTRFAPVVLLDRQDRRLAWIGPLLLLAGGIALHLIAVALFSGARNG